jgi:hypothetical protein
MGDWCPENDRAWQAEMAAIHGEADKALRIQIESLKAENARLRELDMTIAKESDARMKAEAMLQEARLEGARAMQEAAAKIADNVGEPSRFGRKDDYDKGWERGAAISAKYIRAIDPATVIKQKQDT